MLKELVLAASSSEFRRRVLVLGVRESERPQYSVDPTATKLGYYVRRRDPKSARLEPRPTSGLNYARSRRSSKNQAKKLDYVYGSKQGGSLFARI